MPGPWRIVDECEGAGGYLVSETIDDISIAEVFKHNSQSEERDKANAILIAEAPELKKLLCEALWYVDESAGMCRMHDYADKLSDRICACLSKIEGGDDA